MCFPQFQLNGMALRFVSEFKYLGHIINNNLSDDDDIRREMRSMFMRSNILLRRHSKCSLSVKLTVFNQEAVHVYGLVV